MPDWRYSCVCFRNKLVLFLFLPYPVVLTAVKKLYILSRIRTFKKITVILATLMFKHLYFAQKL